jgi:hypothetical protein
MKLNPIFVKNQVLVAKLADIVLNKKHTMSLKTYHTI